MAEYLLDNEVTRQAVLRKLESMVDDGKLYKVTIDEKKPGQMRSLQQNAALHLWFTRIADILLCNGITRGMLYSRARDEARFPPRMDDVKDIYRVIGEALTGAKSTANIPKDKLNDVNEVFCSALAQRMGIDPGPMPSTEELMQSQLRQEYERDAGNFI